MERSYGRSTRSTMNTCISSTIPAVLAAALLLAGCTTKSTVSTTTGNEPGTSGNTSLSQSSAGGADRGGGDRITGFSKTPADERIVQPTPTVVARVDSSQTHAGAAPEETTRQLADIYFAFDKWNLSEEGKKNLAESAQYLKQHPDNKIVVEGYCDERGSREYNLVLGEKRARESMRYLAALGIKNPMSITSYGKERQVCNEHDESCYWKNRRGHLLLNDGK